MKDNPLKDALESIARDQTPENINLWPRVSTQLNRRKSLMQTMRAQPLLIVVIIVVALLALTGAAYAIGKATGYLPGVGFVDQGVSLRMLAAPVSQTRAGVTVTVEQVIVDSQRTVIVYKAEGLTISAANSKGEGGGPFGSEDLLRLPDGSTLKETPDLGYRGIPEPLINNIQTQGGWPNYVGRLVYPPVPAQVNDLSLLIPVLQNMPQGAAPENWEITFHLKPAPADMTLEPVIVFTPPSTASTTTTPVAGATGVPALSDSATQNGFTIKLDNVVELQDGFVFTGNLSWSESAFPTGKGMIAEEIIPTLTDAGGHPIPVEDVPLNAPYYPDHLSWSVRTDRKAFVGPLTLSLPSIQTNIQAPAIDFAMDFGANPQIGQSRDVNRDFVVEGSTIRLLSVGLVDAPDNCQGVGLDFNFSGDTPGIFATVEDAVPQEPMTCTDGGGGGGGPLDSRAFSAEVSYSKIPTGIHHFSINVSIPFVVNGPWRVRWNPPFPSEPTPTSEPGACLTLDKWHQISGQNEPLPAGLGGKIVTEVNEGGPLPMIYVSNLDGTNSLKIGTGAWPSLSADGKRLVYSASDGLHVLDLSSRVNTALGTDGYSIIWSPDNTRMIYTTTSSLYVVNADGTGLRRIDTGSAQVISPVGWLADRETIVYAAMSGTGFTFTTHNLQTGETKKLFSFQNKAGFGAISPDGQWIVFADHIFGATNWGIFVSRMDRSERKLVVDPEVPTGFASVWSPDGQWLATTTQENAGPEIPVLVNPFTCEAVRLNKVNGTVDAWSP